MAIEGAGRRRVPRGAGRSRRRVSAPGGGESGRRPGSLPTLRAASGRRPEQTEPHDGSLVCQTGLVAGRPARRRARRGRGLGSSGPTARSSTLDADSGLDGLEEAVFAGSLFASERLVVVRNAQSLRKADVERLATALGAETVPSDVIVVAVAERTPTPLMNALKGIAEVVRLSRPRRGELVNWVNKRLKRVRRERGTRRRRDARRGDRREPARHRAGDRPAGAARRARPDVSSASTCSSTSVRSPSSRSGCCSTRSSATTA